MPLLKSNYEIIMSLLWFIWNFIVINNFHIGSSFTEEVEKPADLSQRIVFKSKNSVRQVATTSESESKKTEKKRPTRHDINKQKLSFQVEDDDEEDSEGDE